MEVMIGNSKLELVEGDITDQDTDAIVNAANSGLRGGGGVDGAIHRAGGPSIMEECRTIGRCPTGQAVITSAGRLKCRKVIHAVGPIFSGGGRGESALLASAYRTCLKLASDNALASVAFPSISTGAYGYPVEAAAEIALCTVMDYLKKHADIELVRFVLFGADAYAAYERVLKRVQMPDLSCQ